MGFHEYCGGVGLAAVEELFENCENDLMIAAVICFASFAIHFLQRFIPIDECKSEGKVSRNCECGMKAGNKMENERKTVKSCVKSPDESNNSIASNKCQRKTQQIDEDVCSDAIPQQNFKKQKEPYPYRKYCDDGTCPRKKHLKLNGKSCLCAKAQRCPEVNETDNQVHNTEDPSDCEVKSIEEEIASPECTSSASLTEETAEISECSVLSEVSEHVQNDVIMKQQSDECSTTEQRKTRNTLEDRNCCNERNKTEACVGGISKGRKKSECDQQDNQRNTQIKWNNNVVSNNNVTTDDGPTTRKTEYNNRSKSVGNPNNYRTTIHNNTMEEEVDPWRHSERRTTIYDPPRKTVDSVERNRRTTLHSNEIQNRNTTVFPRSTVKDHRNTTTTDTHPDTRSRSTKQKTRRSRNSKEDCRCTKQTEYQSGGRTNCESSRHQTGGNTIADYPSLQYQKYYEDEEKKQNLKHIIHAKKKGHHQC